MAQPSDIPGLALWFRAADLAGLADGVAVTSWTSLAGTAVASQGVGANQPTKQTVAGKTCARFDGSNDLLSINGDGLTFSQNVPGISVFVRVRLNALPAAGGIFGASINGATSARVLMRTTSGFFQIGGRRNDGDTFTSVGDIRQQATTVVTLTGVLDYANTDQFMWVDGQTGGTNTTFLTAGNTTNLVSNTATIGASPDSTNPSSMDLYELAVYNRAVTGAERADIETYLNPPSAFSVFRSNVRIV